MDPAVCLFVPQILLIRTCVYVRHPLRFRYCLRAKHSTTLHDWQRTHPGVPDECKHFAMADAQLRSDFGADGIDGGV